jgi:RNA polymerase sigma-70 factor (ECF subfamily)
VVAGNYTSEETRQVQAAKVNPAAFDTLYQRYMPQVYRYLRARTHSEDDAADLTQQVFLQALNALPNYQERGLPFAAWLFRIAHNTVVNSYRRNHPNLDWDALPEAMHPAATQDPETTALQHESLSQLQQLLTQLSHDKRELLALHFAAGLTTREIAAMVGKSEAAVKKQLSRTVQALKKDYGEHYHDNEA